MTKIIPMQTLFKRPIDIVLGNLDYQVLVEDLELMSEIISSSGLEAKVMTHFLNLAKERSNKELSAKKRIKAQKNALLSLYCCVLRKYLNLSYRDFALTLAAAPIYQNFCGIENFLEVRALDFRAINKLENTLTPELLEELNRAVLKNFAFDSEKTSKAGFVDTIDLEHLYTDSTCMEANIHYPVDWVLFRDLIRTSMLKVEQIRELGLKVRMPYPPKEFLSEMNKLCIEMHNAYRKKDAKKIRKTTFRRMKRHLNQWMGHVKAHLAKFESERETVNVGLAKSIAIMNCLRDILSQYKDIIKIAHQRIINEKVLKAEEKILSIYEDDVHIITKNKSGVNTEFGNTLHFMEQVDGLVVDYHFVKDVSPGDPTLGMNSLSKLIEIFGADKIKSIVGDRGYDSEEFRNLIATINQKYNVNIENNILPLNPHELAKRMQDKEFKAHHKRRASTEGKVAHLKDIIGNPILQKGMRNKKLHIGISVLAHNLKRLAKMRREQIAKSEAA